MIINCQDCNRLTSGDCGKHGPQLIPVDGAVFAFKAVDAVLRCEASGNPCGTDTVHNGRYCTCASCRQWRAAFKQGLEAAAIAAAPYHNSINGRGCPRFCSACERSREIQDAIRAMAAR